jgi:hypothetical protein
MPLPTPTKTTNEAKKDVDGAAAAVTEAVASNIKQFGPAKNADGVEIPSPTPKGINLVDLSKTLYATVEGFVKAAGTNMQDFVDACAAIDKTDVPGHKNGRLSYATSNVVQSLAKSYNILNKVRGVGGAAALKKKVEEKDARIAALMAKLAAANISAD